MKLLQLCGKDYYGAGRAAYRLHKGLLDAGIESKMLVGKKRTIDNTVTNIQKSERQKLFTKVYINIEKILIKIRAGGSKELFSIGTPAHSIRKLIKKEKPDIIHLHWINRGFINLYQLKGLKIPVVISLHDMWWFTGGCHYDGECERYIKNCGYCPQLVGDKEFDLSSRHLHAKLQILNSISYLTFIGLSSWMKDCIQKSIIGKGHKLFNLPNGIDIDEFSPVNEEVCRETLGLPKDKKLILFAAVNALSVERKGYSYITQALKQLNEEHYQLVVIGGEDKKEQISGLKAYFLGEISDDSKLIEYLSAVDVTIVPSLQENLSNLIMESMACGTPVTAFNIGGNGDMIIHKQNGYLAQFKDVNDLATGISFCCNEDVKDKLSNQARKIIKDYFDIKKVSKKYIDLYHNILEK